MIKDSMFESKLTSHDLEEYDNRIHGYHISNDGNITINFENLNTIHLEELELMGFDVSELRDNLPKEKLSYYYDDGKLIVNEKYLTHRTIVDLIISGVDLSEVAPSINKNKLGFYIDSSGEVVINEKYINDYDMEVILTLYPHLEDVINNIKESLSNSDVSLDDRGNLVKNKRSERNEDTSRNILKTLFGFKVTTDGYLVEDIDQLDSFFYDMMCDTCTFILTGKVKKQLREEKMRESLEVRREAEFRRQLKRNWEAQSYEFFLDDGEIDIDDYEGVVDRDYRVELKRSRKVQKRLEDKGHYSLLNHMIQLNRMDDMLNDDILTDTEERNRHLAEVYISKGYDLRDLPIYKVLRGVISYHGIKSDEEVYYDMLNKKKQMEFIDSLIKKHENEINTIAYKAGILSSIASDNEVIKRDGLAAYFVVSHQVAVKYHPGLTDEQKDYFLSYKFEEPHDFLDAIDGMFGIGGEDSDRIKSAVESNMETHRNRMERMSNTKDSQENIPKFKSMRQAIIKSGMTDYEYTVEQESRGADEFLHYERQ